VRDIPRQIGRRKRTERGEGTDPKRGERALVKSGMAHFVTYVREMPSVESE